MWQPGAEEISAPYIHDRKWGVLNPYARSDQWWKSPHGIWVEVKQLLANESGYIYHGEATWPHVFGINSGTVTQTTLGLTTPYVYNSAGHVVAWRIQPNEAGTITNIYYYATSITGTPGTIIELRNDGSPKPGTTAHISTTHSPTVVGWQNVSGLSFATTARTVYWLCVGAGAGNTAGHTVTAIRYINFAGSNQSEFVHFSNSTNAANGFASNPTMDGRVGAFLLVYSNGAVWGRPFTSVVTPASSTNKRGSRFSSQFFAADLRVAGVIWSSAHVNISGVNIYEGTNGPSAGESLITADFITSATPQKQGCWFGDAGYLFRAGAQYSVVNTFSAATTAGILRMQIGTGSDANLKAAMPGGGAHTYVEESGGAWVETTDEMASCWYLIEQEVAPTGGGGSNFSTPLLN